MGSSRAAAAVLVLTIGGTSCSLFTKNPISPPGGVDGGSVISNLDNCLASDVHSVVVQILPAVATAIASSGYVAELGNLIAQFGVAAVTCGVAALETELEAAHFAGAADAEVETMLANARAFLKLPPVAAYVAPVVQVDPRTTHSI